MKTFIQRIIDRFIIIPYLYFVISLCEFLRLAAMFTKKFCKVSYDYGFNNIFVIWIYFLNF